MPHFGDKGARQALPRARAKSVESARDRMASFRSLLGSILEVEVRMTTHQVVQVVRRRLGERLEHRVLLAATTFVDLIDNPYLPMIPGSTYVYRGVDEDGKSLRDRVQVTDQTRVIMGVTTTVVRDRVFVDGELAEDTRDFFAQDHAGNVWYFGEDSREIENGVVVSTEGSWIAGVNGATPGIIMKAHPAVGDAYHQEVAPGVAEDDARILGLHERVSVPFATFGDCLRIEESTALEPNVLEEKLYAPGIGFVQSQGTRGENEVLKLAYVQLGPEAFSDTIDNPFLPMIPGTTFVYRGVDDEGKAMRSRVQVTDQTRQILGVTTTVVRDRVFVDDELAEDTRDFFAQDKAGNVWYFGEDSKDIENGVVVSTEGSWLAGVDGATPGIIMKAHPGVGDEHQQEKATGVAEDQARVLAFGERVKVPFGTFGDSLKIAETTPLEPNALEHKLYAPGIGFIESRNIKGGKEVLRLAYIQF
jgi:hypothetical protein